MVVQRRLRALVCAVPIGLVMCSSGLPADRSSSGQASSDASVSDGTAIPPADGASAGLDVGRGDDGERAAGEAATDVEGSAATTACPASDAGNIPLGKDMPDVTGTAVDAITYTNVGVAGSYDQVIASTVAPSCVPNVCDKTAKAVSGPLVPFDEEMTMVFSGPIDLYQIAAYEPGAKDYDRIAYWDRCTTEGLAFVGNKAWYQCNGYVQSYVSPDGATRSDAPVQFAGHLDPGVGVNIMRTTPCAGTTAGSDCGFSRGLALHGFKGDAAGSKVFAAKFRMPVGNVTPAYWILPAQVVRSAQYGCNCRGQGGQGGCGELDVAEVLGGSTATPAHPMQATTTIYSFQGVTNGGTSYFQRPVYETATFVVVFDAPSRSIALRRLAATEFDFGAVLPAAVVGRWLANAGTSRTMP
jgi:Tos1-like cell wall protein